MKTNVLRKGIIILAAMLVMCFVPAASFAEVVPDLTQDTGSLNIHLVYHDEDVDTPVDGAKFTIYKLASMRVKGGDCRFTLEKDFAETGIDMDGMTASESNEAAKTCSEIVKAKGLTGESKTTNGQGDASFTGLSFGMYLVMQTGATGSAEKYSYVTPYMVMVPLFYEEEDSWIYDVYSEPKEMLTQPPTNELPPIEGEGSGGGEEGESGEKKEAPPDDESTGDAEGEDAGKSKKYRKLIDTSDPTQMALLGGVIVLSAACLGLIVTRKRHDEE